MAVETRRRIRRCAELDDAYIWQALRRIVSETGWSVIPRAWVSALGDERLMSLAAGRGRGGAPFLRASPCAISRAFCPPPRAAMSSEHEDAAAVLFISDAVTFASLPLALACRVFLALPLEDRGRASCVCRAWRDALAEPALWTRLDMAGVGGGWLRICSVLNGAAARAPFQLRQLNVSQQHVAWPVLLLVLTANAGSLRELHMQVLRRPSTP